MPRSFGNFPAPRPLGSAPPSRLGMALLTVCLFLWFALAGGAFWIILSRFENEELAAKALGHISWPYAIFALSLPAILLLVSNIRQLIAVVMGFKDAIDRAPEQLQTSLETAEHLREKIEQTGGQVINKMAQSLGELEARMNEFEGRWDRLNATRPATDHVSEELSPRERLAEHIGAASALFYEVLERWNENASDQKVVSRGGGNRPELVRELRDKNAFASDKAANDAVAQYLSEAFRMQLSSRRGAVQKTDIGRLDQLKRAAEEAGTKFPTD